MFKTIIHVNIWDESGCDVFHINDAFLTENDSYNIKDILTAIAKDIQKRLNEMKMELTYDSKTVNTIILENIPSITDIRKHIENQENFTVQSKDEKSLYVEWNPEKQELYQSYDNELWLRTTTYQVKHIKIDDILYVPVEDFTKESCMPVSRFYQIPTSDETTAIQILNNMKLHNINGYESTKQMLITTKDELIHNRWGKRNLSIINLLLKHPEYDNPKYFHPCSDTHLKILNEYIQ